MSVCKRVDETIPFITKDDYPGEGGKLSWGMSSSVEAAVVVSPVASMVTWRIPTLW